MRTLSALSLISVLSVFAPRASAEVVTEPGSGVAFEANRTFEGRPYVLVGTGLRKKFGFKVYAMGLYVDESEAKRAFSALATRAGGSDHNKLTSSDHAQSFILWGQFPKVAVLHMLRNLSAEKIRDAFKENFESQFAGSIPDEMKPSIDQMLALLDRDLKRGQEIVFRSSADGRVELDIDGQKRPGPQNVKVVRALWAVWLGPKTVSKEMRKSLVDRIDVLGR